MRYNYGPTFISLIVLLLGCVLLVSCRDTAEYKRVKHGFKEMQVVDDSTMSEDETVRARASTADATQMKWSEILRKFGVDNLPNDVIALLDHANDIFEKHTSDTEFNAMNEVLATLKESFQMTLEVVRKPENRPSGSLEPSTVSELFDVMQQHFMTIMMQNPSVSRARIEPFVTTYIGHFFTSIKELYAKGYQMGLSLNWSMIFLLLPLLEQVPTDLFFRDAFQEILSVPGQLKQTLHDFLEDMFSGDQAHFVRMILSFIQTIDWQRLFKNEKVEL